MALGASRGQNERMIDVGRILSQWFKVALRYLEFVRSTV